MVSKFVKEKTEFGKKKRRQCSLTLYGSRNLTRAKDRIQNAVVGKQELE